MFKDVFNILLKMIINIVEIEKEMGYKSWEGVKMIIICRFFI